MRTLGKLTQHVHLLTRMARTTETDLVAAYATGDLSQSDWADMVQACRRCPWSAECADWLDNNQTVGIAPETCQNRNRIAALGNAMRQRALLDA